jgi:hypothetical protein
MPFFVTSEMQASVSVSPCLMDALLEKGWAWQEFQIRVVKGILYNREIYMQNPFTEVLTIEYM